MARAILSGYFSLVNEAKSNFSGLLSEVESATENSDNTMSVSLLD